MKILLTLIALLLSFLASQAQTVVVDGIKYELSYYGTTDMNTGINTTHYVAYVCPYDNSDDFANNKNFYKGNIQLPQSVNHNTKEYTVIGISSNAFKNCDQLTSLTIPSSVNNVDGGAFSGCSALRKVIIEDSNTTLVFSCQENISSLESLGAFQNLPVEEVYIGRNIIRANGFNGYDHGGIFQNCNLNKITICENVNTISEKLFSGCTRLQNVELGDNVIAIEDFAFSCCTSLTSLGLTNVMSMGNSAFSGCSSLASVDMPNVTSIGNSAFSGCSSLASVDMPNVASIGNSAFSGCSSLTELTIPGSVTSIGSSAFYNCNNINKLVIADSDSSLSLGNHYDSNNYSTYFGLFYPLSLEEVYLGRNLAYNYGNLDYFTTIQGPFEDSKEIKKITIGDKVTSIGSGLFKDCPNEMTINIPASVKEIKDDAFSGDWAILKFNDTIPATIGSAFTGHNLLVVPDSVYTDYYNAWTNYQGQILSDAYPLEYDVEVTAKGSDSDVLSKVLDGGPSSKALNVVDLKVKGSINSYDIMVMRNKMLNLRNLDLSEADIVPSSYEYYTGYHTTDSVIGPYSFYNLTNLKSVKLPNSVKTISGAAFAECRNLEKLKFGTDNVNIKSSPDNYYNSVTYENIYLGAFAHCNLNDVSFNEKLTNIGTYAFYSNKKLENIELSDSLENISNYAFSGCSLLATVKMGPKLATIGQYAFQNCSKLTDVTFSPALTSIGTYGFSGCSSLETIMLPTSLKSIGTYAFSGCSKLKNVRIPASIEVIGDYAFNTSSITDIYTWTIEPTNINQNTFNSELFTKAMLHVPETSSYLYYWDTQWSQFLNFTEFNEPYEYFYLKNKDLVEDEDTPRIEGEDGNNPDADIHPGGGLIVDGDQSQNLGVTYVVYDGLDNSGSIIGGESSTAPSGDNVNIDDLYIKIQISANKWYFFAFPFEIALNDLQFDGQFVWRYYDGEYRAVHGNGAWKTMDEPRLQPGKGYIFQGSKSGTLTLRVGHAAIGGEDKLIELVNHASSNLQNASWNLIGNPFTSYYPISDMDYSSPITIWNGSTYTAYNPNDDDVTLHPFQAFFVQKPEANTNMGFLAQHRITKNQRDDKATMSRAQERRMAKSRSAVNREIVNIEVSDGETTDMTRVVFNEESLGTYELACDASKFMSDSAPQIYTMDATNVKYSINERPVANGIVRLGFTANHSGKFTISASRLDCPMWLKDVATGVVCDLSTDDFEFTSDAGTFDDRFLLINANVGPTGIADIEGDNDVDAVYYGVNGMRLQNANTGGVTLVKKGSKVEKIYNK